MIRVSDVSKTYSQSQRKAVDGVSLEVRPGEIFGFLGPNGAGKTTLIKSITGILQPDRGTILINGYSIKEQPLEAKRQFGYVPDDPSLFGRLSGLEYLNFMADIYRVDSNTRKLRITEMGSRFEMDDALPRLMQSFSHGMKQKIVVMGALLHDPAIWILDEPMTGLDPRSSFILKEMMREHAGAGKTVFFSTHILDVAEKICDRIAIINRGKLVFCGSLEEMRHHFQQNSSLESLFLEITAHE